MLTIFFLHIQKAWKNFLLQYFLSCCKICNKTFIVFYRNKFFSSDSIFPNKNMNRKTLFCFVEVKKKIRNKSIVEFTSVVLNLDALAPLGAQIWCLFTNTFWSGVPPNCYLIKKGCRETKRVGNHCFPFSHISLRFWESISFKNN